MIRVKSYCLSRSRKNSPWNGIFVANKISPLYFSRLFTRFCQATRSCGITDFGWFVSLDRSERVFYLPHLITAWVGVSGAIFATPLGNTLVLASLSEGAREVCKKITSSVRGAQIAAWSVFVWVFLKACLHMRFLMRFLMRFRVQNAPYPTLHECFFREASCGLEKKLSHIVSRHPSFQFLLTWWYFVAALRD